MQTTLEQLYSVIGAIVKTSTGRPWWRKVQDRQRIDCPYALVYIAVGTGFEYDTVETLFDNGTILTDDLILNDDTVLSSSIFPAPYGTDLNDETQLIDSTALSGGKTPTVHEVVWGAVKLTVEVEFFSSSIADPVTRAASRFRNSLRLSARFYDLWTICGLIGSIDILDFSTVFRGDTEGRVRVSFNLYANLTDEPLADTYLFDIEKVDLGIIHVRQDGLETTISHRVVAPTEGE